MTAFLCHPGICYKIPAPKQIYSFGQQVKGAL